MKYTHGVVESYLYNLNGFLSALNSVLDSGEPQAEILSDAGSWTIANTTYQRSRIVMPHDMAIFHPFSIDGERIGSISFKRCIDVSECGEGGEEGLEIRLGELNLSSGLLLPPSRIKVHGIYGDCHAQVFPPSYKSRSGLLSWEENHRLRDLFPTNKLLKNSENLKEV